MTNKRLEYLCRNVDVSNAKWLIPGEVAMVDFHDSTEKGSWHYEDFIVLFNKGVRVGAVLPMGSVDVHMFTLPEHRNKGYMSKFFRTGIINKLHPRLKKVTTNYATLEENEFYAEIIELMQSEKLSPADKDFKRRFESEAKMRRQIEHIMSLAGLRVEYVPY